MTVKREPYKARPGWGYRALRSYVRLFHDHFYYRRVYWINRKNIPEKGPVMLVSDHQNGLSDPLGFVVSVKRARRKLRMIARADVFKPIFAPILRWMGILPAYRSSYNGPSTAIRNRSTLEEAEQELINGGTVGIYPEAGHQDKRWLGRFSVGYLHIVFEAARKTGFEEEIFIIPSCNHYSDYFEMREQMLVWYGEPVPAKPYYELFRKNPQEARQNLNTKIREKVSELMLNITDLDNYDAIDFLRNTYGMGYARKQGYDPGELPDKLTADKELFARLEKAKKEDETTLQGIYNDTVRLKEGIESLRINDNDFNRSTSCTAIMLWLILLVILAPLFVVACIPNALIYYAQRSVTAKVEDQMLHSGINFAGTVLLAMPVLYLITFALMWFLFSLPVAFIHLLCLPFLGIFAWKYSRSWRKWVRAVRFRRLCGRGRLVELFELRESIYKRLDRILG